MRHWKKPNLITGKTKDKILRTLFRFDISFCPKHLTTSAGRPSNHNDLHGSNWSIGGGGGKANGDYSELRTIVRRDGRRECPRNSTRLGKL